MENLNVLVSLLTENNDYQREQAAIAHATAQRLGIQVEVIYAQNDAVQQTQQILHYIQKPSRRPDAILVEPVGTGMFQVARAAVAAGISWGIVNASVDYLSMLRQQAKVPVFCVSSDNEQIGKIQGQQIAALLGDSGCVLAIEGPTTRDVARMRSKGMNLTKPRGVTVKTLKGDWTQQSGIHAMKSWLSLSTSRELHVGMIACQNDDMAMGVRRAIEEIADTKERDHWLGLPLTGCDGVAKAGQSWVRQGRLAATVVSPPIVGDAMNLFVTARRGGSLPPEVSLIAPSSFPPLAELKKSKAASAS